MSSSKPFNRCDKVELISSNTVEAKAIDWLWPNYLARGAFHVMAGSPGTGKTSLAIEMAAIVSGGYDWPDGTQSPQGDVLYWSCEDDLEYSLKPRLSAASADATRVHFVGDFLDSLGRRRYFDPARHIDALMAAVRELENPLLIVLDPVVSAIGKTYNNAEVRRALKPLIDLATELNCAILGITHFNKNSKGHDPLDRVTGSLAIGAQARVILCTATGSDRDSPRVLVRAKSNIGPDGGGFEYKLAQVTVSKSRGISAQRIEWGDALVGDARTLLREAESPVAVRTSVLDEAVDLLSGLLADGPKPKNEIAAEAENAGVSRKTLQRAKEKLGVISKKAEFGGPWHWRLPRSLPKQPEDTQSADMATLGKDGNLRDYKSDLAFLESEGYLLQRQQWLLERIAQYESKGGEE